MPQKPKNDQRTANSSNNRQISNSKDNGAQDGKGAEDVEIPGLLELVALVETIATTPPGKEPELDPDALKVLEATPLNLVYDALKPVFLKLAIAEAAVEAKSPWSKTSGNAHEAVIQLKAIEEKVDVISRKTDEGFKNALHEAELKSTSQALEEKIMSSQETTATLLISSAKDSQSQLESIQNEVKLVPVTVKTHITALEVRFAELSKELVEDSRGRIQKLEDKNDVLERELKELRGVVDATSFALIPVKFALESALSGDFLTRREAKAACVDAFHAFVPSDTAELAEGVRGDVFQLLSCCQGLFSVLSKSQTEPSGTLEIGGGFEEHWAQAVESVHRLRVDAQFSNKKEQDSIHQLRLFGFLVGQVRDGQYSLDQWAEASQQEDFGDYMDQPFDGFDALQTVAEEIQRLRKTNSLLKRQLLPSTARGVTQPSKGGWSPLMA